MTSATTQPDWAALAASYHQATTADEPATADALASYRRRRWNFADHPQVWLTQEQLPFLAEPQALALYRAAGGRHTAQFRANPIAEVRDAADFLLYDTIKLESRFDECASPEGAFGLNGAGREWPSYLLTLHEPALFAPWSPHTERGLRRLGMFPSALKRGHVGLCYLELLDILEYLRARLGLPDFRAVDEFCYLNGRTQRTPS